MSRRRKALACNEGVSPVNVRRGWWRSRRRSARETKERSPSWPCGARRTRPHSRMARSGGSESRCSPNWPLSRRQDAGITRAGVRGITSPRLVEQCVGWAKRAVRANACAIPLGCNPKYLNVMAGFMPAIHVLLSLCGNQRRGWHRKSGLRDFRIIMRRKSGIPDL